MKCVLTVAGLGTRLLPLTKELPKEMMPIYDKTKNGEIILKPVVQVIYESLYRYNLREFCFVVGRTKRAVRDHFKPDFELVKLLRNTKKEKLANLLEDFFAKLKRSNIVFTYQKKPIGFGDAIQCSRRFVGRDNFLLHAGDDIVISQKNDHLRRLQQSFKKYNADITCLLEIVENPSQYGVVKPKKPRSKYAIIAIYIFRPTIFQYLDEAKKYAHPENQLAEAFNIAIKRKQRMIGVILKKNERRFDVGTPESYSKVLVSLRRSI